MNPFSLVSFSSLAKSHKNGIAHANLSVQNANDGTCFNAGLANVCISANMSCTSVSARCVVTVDGWSYSFRRIDDKDDDMSLLLMTTKTSSTT